MKTMTWTELSNALSFGGTTRPKKRPTVKLTKEERDAMWQGMTVGEIKEVLRYKTEEEKERFHAIRKTLALRHHAQWQEAMIRLENEKEDLQ